MKSTKAILCMTVLGLTHQAQAADFHKAVIDWGGAGMKSDTHQTAAHPTDCACSACHVRTSTFEDTTN